MRYAGALAVRWAARRGRLADKRLVRAESRCRSAHRTSRPGQHGADSSASPHERPGPTGGIRPTHPKGKELRGRAEKLVVVMRGGVRLAF